MALLTGFQFHLHEYQMRFSYRGHFGEKNVCAGGRPWDKLGLANKKQAGSF